MSGPLLEVRDLSAAYGGIQALNHISLEVGAGQVVSVLGANGAGKSTLLNCISALIRPRTGSILLGGEALPPKPHGVVKAGIAHAPEGRRILADLTVRENLLAGAFLRRDRESVRQDMKYVYTLFPRLKEREKQYGGLLSGGEQQMLAISRAIMAKPAIMMLDEPSLGLAPVIVNRIFDIIKELKETGMSILLVEQNAYKALSISDRAYILSAGDVVAQGTAEELLQEEALTRAYLG